MSKLGRHVHWIVAQGEALAGVEAVFFILRSTLATLCRCPFSILISRALLDIPAHIGETGWFDTSTKPRR